MDAKQPNASKVAVHVWRINCLVQTYADSKPSCKNGKDDDDEVAESDSSQIVTFDDDLELESFCV